MGSLRDALRCVILLVSGAEEIDDGAAAACRVAAVLPAAGPAPLVDVVARHIAAFCAAHDVPLDDCGDDAAALRVKERGTARRVSLLRVKGGDVRGVRAGAAEGPFLLLELAVDAAVPCGADDGGEWRWLRPVPSCLAELAAGGRHAALRIPAAVRCAHPVVRAVAPSLPPSSWTADAVTLDGLLREVAYKMNYMPKYGS